MRERPILFSGPMVLALGAGTKTQTRRVLKPTPPPAAVSFGEYYHPDPRPHFWAFDGDALMDFAVPCPYGQPGDRLWVREAWSTHAFMDATPPRDLRTISIHYWADGDIRTGKRRPGMFMPRRYSRILLEVTEVRVERLQDISEADAIAEGIEKTGHGFWSLYGTAGVDGTYSARSSYRALWGSINGADSWDANPWVWAVSFKRVA